MSVQMPIKYWLRRHSSMLCRKRKSVRIALKPVIYNTISEFSENERATKVSTSQMMSKVSSCFICGQQFDFKDLNEHERSCLENIKSNDVLYTRQNTEEHVSSVSSKAESLSLSNPSNHSTSSNEGCDKKCIRCYICGDDVPTYLKGIHEKSCKKNWESGLLQTERRGSVRADIFRSLSRSNSRADVNNEPAKPGGLRKAKSTTLFRAISCANAHSVSNDKLNDSSSNMRCKNSKSSSNLNTSTSNISKSTSNLSKSTTNLSKSVTNLNKKRTPVQDRGINGFATKHRTAYSSHSDISKKPSTNVRSTSATPMRNYKSVTNLKLDVPKASAKNNPLDKTKSLQDLRRTSSPMSPTHVKSPVDKKRGSSTPSSPQYVVCHLCGKLYSQHSIIIHIKQCEKTIDMQKSMGTNVDYKIKSRSLADLSKGKTNTGTIGRVSSTTSPTLRRNRPLSGRPSDPLKRSTSLSMSVNNLTLNSKKKMATEEISKNVPKENILPVNAKKEINETESRDSITTPGLQKCYLCGQLYGTRSLPIHQKQCYVKQERLREQESQTKKRKKRDIKVIPFGKAKFPESPISQASSPPKLFEIPSRSVLRSNSCLTPSRAFSVDSLINKKDSELCTEKDSNKETNGYIGVNRSLSSSVSSGNDSQSPSSLSSSMSFKDMMMTCVHCGCQCEPYTMTIHEKVCRKVALDDVVSSPEIRIENSPGEPHSMEETITKSGLIHCEGCNGEFFSSEIFQHRINCRTSIL